MATGWDGYVVNLKNCGAEDVAIYGDDGSKWACSEGLDNLITDTQIKELCGSSENMRVKGPTVGKMKCFLLKDSRDDENNLCLELKATADCGKKTVCVGRSKKAVVIAVAPADKKITNDVFKITKYLKENNY